MHSHSPDLRHPDISSCDAIFVLETEMRKCNFSFTCNTAKGVLAKKQTESIVHWGMVSLQSQMFVSFGRGMLK